MALEFYSSLDLNKNELQNTAVHNLATPPSNPVEGQLYYDITGGDKSVYVWNGSAWISLSAGGEAGAGDITSVVAGAGMTGGATTGDATLNVIGGDGITANANDVAITAAQTTITSISNAALKIGRDQHNLIDFATTDDRIFFRAADANQIVLVDGALLPVTNNDVDLGSSSLEFKNAYFDGTVTSDAFAGPLTGNVTGNASGSSGTVTSIGNLTGEVTSSNRATVIADNIVDEANLKVSNAPTNGYYLTAQSGNTGGLTWAAIPTLNQNTTGSAATLTTARAINGVDFDGSAAITVTAAAGTLSGDTLKSSVVTSSLTSVGTIATGVWNGTVIASAYLDADTAHLTTAQTFTGSKTFGTTTKLNFRDANAYINSPTANDIEVAATTITLDAASDIQLEGNTTVTGNFSVSGTLNVDGTTTTIDSTTVAIADSMLKLAKDQANTADVVDFGFYGQYGVSGTAKYAGVFRDVSANGDPFVFFDGLQAEPGATVNTAGTGYDLAPISAGRIDAADGFYGDVTGDITGDITGDVTGNADTATVLATARTIGGVSFNGSANIDLPGVNSAGNQNTSGSAATLTTARAINGVDFNGSAAITVTAAAGTLSGDTLKSTVVTSSLTTVGTLAAGDATAIVSAATASAAGKVELATAAEVLTGTDAARVVTADTLSAKSVVATIAQSSLTDSNTVTITHNLGTADVMVQLFDMTTEANVYADIARTTDDMATASTSVVSIDFGAAPPNDVRCLITSLKGATAGTLAYT
jgi:predicted small integral membrane protein